MSCSQGIQRCIRCDGLTGKSTEDSVFLGERGPFCEECADRLIAAAPEMLEALIRLECQSGLSLESADPARVAARKAITKARGEE